MAYRLKLCGIYSIRHTASGRRYIGQARNIFSRWSKHRRELEIGAHCNPRLTAAWAKYGREAFVFEIIEECAATSLSEREQFWMDHFGSYRQRRGFNVAISATAPMTGKIHSPEAKQRIGLAQRGKPKSPETRARMSAYWSGRPKSAEHRASLSKARMGRSVGPLSDGTRERLRQAALKRWADPDFKAKAIARQRSPEGRSKTSAGSKAAWARRKANAI